MLINMGTLGSHVPPIRALGLAYHQLQRYSQHQLLHRAITTKMSAQDIVTAYQVAVPVKQEQHLPGLDKKLARMSLIHPVEPD